MPPASKTGIGLENKIVIASFSKSSVFFFKTVMNFNSNKLAKMLKDIVDTNMKKDTLSLALTLRRKRSTQKLSVPLKQPSNSTKIK